MYFEEIMTECSTKDVALTYKEFLDDYLPEHLKQVAHGIDSPEIILNRIDRVQKKLDYINNTPLEEQIENYIKGYQKWREDSETRLTDEQKNLRDRCKNTINELYKWEPLTESSIYFKGRLIDHIKALLAQSIYARELFIHPETPDAESAEREIVFRKKRFTEWIKNLKRKYKIAIELKKERDILEIQLRWDLELLA